MTIIYLLAIIVAMMAFVVMLLMLIQRQLELMNRNLLHMLGQMADNINDDSSRVLKMDCGRKPARSGDRSKKWIQEHETASRG